MSFKDLQSGLFLKAKFCGVFSKNVKSKKGDTYDFFYLVVERSAISAKIFLQLSKEAVSKGIFEKMSVEKLVGVEMIFPCYVKSYEGGVNYFYDGSELPKPVSLVAVSS